jgi:hypothetical protein
MKLAFAMEIAYRLPGQKWRRKTFKTERQLQAFLDKLYDQGAEVRFGS